MNATAKTASGRITPAMYTLIRDAVTILVIPASALIFGILWCHEGRLTSVEVQCREIPPPEVKQALQQIDSRLERIERKLDE